MKYLAIIALMLACTLAQGAGMRSHMEMAQRAVGTYFENADAKLPGIEAIFADETNRKAYFAGATFPDWGYPIPGAAGAAEASHWRPFIEAYAQVLMERYPAPLESAEALRQFAFFCGVISHNISDIPWHFNEAHPHGRRYAWERAYEDKYGQPSVGLRGILGDEYTQDIFDHVDFELSPEMTHRDFWWPTDILLEAFERAGVEGATPERLDAGLRLREAAWVGERWVANARLPYILYKRAIPWVHENREGWAYGGYENCAAAIATWNKYWYARWQGWHYFQQQPNYAERLRNEGSYAPYRGVQDTTICSTHTAHNGGWEPLLEAASDSGGTRTILLRFEIAAIPVGERIKQATLWLRPVSLEGAPGSLAIHAMSSPWVEGDGYSHPVDGIIGEPSEVGASWESSGIAPWAVPGAGISPEDANGDLDATLSLAPAEGGPWVAADVTNLVQDWVDGAPNHGMMLRVPAVDSGRVQFYSSQAWKVQEDGLGGGYRIAYRPTLIVKPEDAPGNALLADASGPAEPVSIHTARNP